jgi:hypothetical protein
MQHHREPDGTLVVTADSKMVDWFLLGAAALCTVPVVRLYLSGHLSLRDATPLIGTAFFLFGAMMSYERSRFSFDPQRAEVRWFRRSLRSRNTGRLPFSDVRSVVLQTAIGNSRTCPSVRLALITEVGELSLTKSYAGGKWKEYEALAQMIRACMKMNTEPSSLLADSLHAALVQGRKLDAVALLRLKKGLSLEAATALVEQQAGRLAS